MGFFTVRQPTYVMSIICGVVLPRFRPIGLFHMVRHRAAPARDRPDPQSEQAAGVDVEYLLGCRNYLHVSSSSMVRRLPKRLLRLLSFTQCAGDLSMVQCATSTARVF